VHAAHNAVFMSIVGSHPKLTTDFDIPLQTLYKIIQLFVHRRLTGKTVKEMLEKELIRLVEKEMYIYKEKLVIDTC